MSTMTARLVALSSTMSTRMPLRLARGTLGNLPSRMSAFSVNQKVEPRPGVLSTPMSPPISEISCLLIIRPRPVPPKRRVIARDPDGVLLTYRHGHGFIVNPVATMGRWRDLNIAWSARQLADVIAPMMIIRHYAGRDWGALEYYDAQMDDARFDALNPRFTIGQTLVEPMDLHGIGASRAEREARACALLEKVGLPTSVMNKYPHEFSGGQRQRIAIARCLTLNPEILVLDEAVSALDVSVQAQVLNLLKDLQDELGLSYIFISHDLGVVRFISDEVLVMQHGDVVEQNSAQALLDNPVQDYTRRLLGAVPRGYQGAAVPEPA